MGGRGQSPGGLDRQAVRAGATRRGIRRPRAIVVLDCLAGRGTCVRALAADVFTSAVVGATLALAAITPLMVLWQVESRPAWLGAMAAQFLWPFAGVLAASAVSERRERRLFPPPEPTRSRDGWLAEFGIAADHDLILQSPGSRKSLVANEIAILTGMYPRQARDLVDNAPGRVMHDVTSERAAKARDLLESLGATVVVIVVGDPGHA